MKTDDPRHGTYGGYQVGCREECCRGAARDYQRQRYFDHRVLNLPPRCVDKTGTERRVHALQRIGWSAEDMSVMLGRSPAFLNVTINRHARRGVNHKTAEMIADLYDRLSMTLGPSERTRVRAEQRGWLPPLAWDDEFIDDPDHRPVGWEYLPATREEQFAELYDRGDGLADMCRSLHLSEKSLEKWCQRNDRAGDFTTLRDRDRGYVGQRNQYSEEAS